MKKKSRKPRRPSVFKTFKNANTNTVVVTTGGATAFICAGIATLAVNAVKKIVNNSTTEQYEMMKELSEVIICTQNGTQKIVEDAKHEMNENLANLGSALIKEVVG